MAQRFRFVELAECIRLSKFRESYYAMIASYMDESYDMKHSGLFVVGGLLAWGVAVFELERRWEALCQRADIDIAYFKAAKCERGAGQFAKFVADPKNIQPAERARLESISCEFIHVLATPPISEQISLFGVGIDQEDFYSIKDEAARAVLGSNPYRLAYDLAFILCAAAMKKLATGDRVSLVCDEHEQYSPLAPESYRALKETNPEAEAYLATCSSADDRDCVPLQAADAVVYEMRKYLSLSLGQRVGTVRKQFRILDEAGLLAMVVHATKENLLHIVAGTKPGEPFRLDAIMSLEFMAYDIPIKL